MIIMITKTGCDMQRRHEDETGLDGTERDFQEPTGFSRFHVIFKSPRDFLKLILVKYQSFSSSRKQKKKKVATFLIAPFYFFFIVKF